MLPTDAMLTWDRRSRGGVLSRVLLTLVLLLVAAAGGAATWMYWRARVCLPQLDGALNVAGLAAPVEVRRDARGVPHLRARSQEDLLFAQGYIAAQDRLWQMDLSRRLAAGELAEIFGERALQLDIENRALGLRHVAERAVGEVDEDSRRMLSAYARGVNAFIATHLDCLPVEFAILRYQPRPWREADSIGVALNMAKILSTSWQDDVERERIRARLSPELYADVFPDHSPLDRPVPDIAAVKAPRAVRSPAVESRSLEQLSPVLAALTAAPETPPSGLGSNNWVVSGRLTKSGKPLLANDPHLHHSVPSVWYMVHLQAPGVNVSGVSFPGLPGVIIGHNERIAWGVTNTGPDVQDVYVEHFDPGHPGQYLHNGQWVDAALCEEIIKVRGKEDVRLRTKVTRHGPVISEEAGLALALRWTALEPRSFGFPFWNIDRAKDWNEFVSALRSFSCPMQNFVFADVEGNIGYYAAAWVPLRRQGDGTVPVDGSTDDYDWNGYIPFEDLPHSFNPASGIIATANSRIVPDSYPYPISHLWDPPYRTARIYQLLESGSPFSVADMLRIQTDIRTLYGAWLSRELLAAAAQSPAEDPNAKLALEILKSWDGEARAESPAPLICEMANRALLERILKPKLGEDLAGYSWPMASVFVQNIIINRWERWLPPGDRDFNVTLVKSLEEGLRRIAERTGSANPNAWRWGDAIAVRFEHPLGSLPLLGRLLNVGPFPQGGTSLTVKPGMATDGASQRTVVDLGDLDNSVENITLGESGQVFSLYYRDQFQAWYEGRSFPMLFSEAAVDRGTVHTLTLQPGER